MRVKHVVPVTPGYGVVADQLPHSTIDLPTLKVTYKGKTATVVEGRLVGPFLDPRSTSYVNVDGSFNLGLKETPKEADTVRFEYDWRERDFTGAEVQLRMPNGQVHWVGMPELRLALTQD